MTESQINAVGYMSNLIMILLGFYLIVRHILYIHQTYKSLYMSYVEKIYEIYMEVLSLIIDIILSYLGLIIGTWLGNPTAGILMGIVVSIWWLGRKSTNRPIIQAGWMSNAFIITPIQAKYWPFTWISMFLFDISNKNERRTFIALYSTISIMSFLIFLSPWTDMALFLWIFACILIGIFLYKYTGIFQHVFFRNKIYVSKVNTLVKICGNCTLFPLILHPMIKSNK